MKKDFLTELGIDEEIAAKIMAENGRDIEREKAKYGDRDTIKEQLASTQAELEKLKALKPEELQAKADELSRQLEKVQAESAQKLAQIETQGKVKDYLAGKKFVNDITREAIAGKITDALSQDSSKGKSLDDIFGELTKDAANIIVDDNAPKPPVQGSMGGMPEGGVDIAKARAVMGLPDKK